MAAHRTAKPCRKKTLKKTRTPDEGEPSPHIGRQSHVEKDSQEDKNSHELATRITQRLLRELATLRISKNVQDFSRSVALESHACFRLGDFVSCWFV